MKQEVGEIFAAALSESGTVGIGTSDFGSCVVLLYLTMFVNLPWHLELTKMVSVLHSLHYTRTRPFLTTLNHVYNLHQTVAHHGRVQGRDHLDQLFLFLNWEH